MIKSINQARQEFRNEFGCKNGTVKPQFREAAETILGYETPLKLMMWTRERGAYELKGSGLYEKVITLLKVMGSDYTIINDSSSGKSADGEVIYLTRRGLARAKSILKDYKLSTLPNI